MINSNLKVSIIGQGYVGQTLAVGAANSGFSVVGFDVNKELISNLAKGNSFVPGVSREILNTIIKSRSYLPTENPELMDNSQIVVIAVPTPIDKDRNPDLTFVVKACESISKYVK